MKFYNPFKPHIVRFDNGQYGIRRRGGPFYMFWMYLNNPKRGLSDEDYWWGIVEEYIKDNAVFDSLGEAQLQLNTYRSPSIKRIPGINDSGTKL